MPNREQALDEKHKSKRKSILRHTKFVPGPYSPSQNALLYSGLAIGTIAINLATVSHSLNSFSR
jgi:hypothetical protein